MNNFSYLHILDGRIRVKIAEVKRSPHLATTLEQRLLDLPGVTHAQANRMSGNVLILHDVAQINTQEILDVLRVPLHHHALARATLPMREKPMATQPSTAGLGSKAAEVIFMKALEIATERLILALL